jgi:hypothetical protein
MYALLIRFQHVHRKQFMEILEPGAHGLTVQASVVLENLEGNAK